MPIDKILGYEYIYDPSDERANRTGKVYVHRIVAEESIGRRLISGEHVHHIDGNRSNNSKENLLVLTSSGHAKLHQRLLGSKERPICECGKHLDYKNKSGKCNDCIDRKNFHVDRDVLEKLVREMPTIHVAKIFGVSDKAIAKRCKSLGIDKPPRGYWAKVRSKGE